MNTAIIGLICYALANGGTLCLQKAESGDFQISCMSGVPGDWQGVAPCQFTMTAPVGIAPIMPSSR